MLSHYNLPLDALHEFGERHPVHKLSLFGSVIREDFGPESDVDVLIEFEPEAQVTLLDMADMKDQLETLFNRSVDLVTPAGLSPYFKQRVLEAAQIVYQRD